MQFLSSRLKAFLRRTKRGSAQLYLDYAAATPVLPLVATLMDTIQRESYGNPGAIHAAGVTAARIVSDARLTLARLLGVRPVEVFFTASGTEANNLAILGYITHLQVTGQAYTDMQIVSTRLEHPSVLAVLKALERRGVTIVYVAVDDAGKIDVSSLREALTDQTMLVTFAYANSEVGIVQDVKRITRAVRLYNTKHTTTIRVHLDAAQAPLWLPCQVHQLGVDMMSLDAGKCNGPKGVGVLIKRAGVTLDSVMLGGGQETGLRAGTENVAAIAGCALAIAHAQDSYPERSAVIYSSVRALVAALRTHVPEAVFNGPDFVDDVAKLERLPNNVHISLPGFDTEYAVIYLDKHGIAASTRSACSGAGEGASATVAEMTGDSARAAATIRFSLDPAITPKEIVRVATVLRQFIDLQLTV